MLNDLLWKLLGKVGIQKEGVYRRGEGWGKPQVPVQTKSPVQDYQAPVPTPSYQTTPVPSPIQQYSTQTARNPEVSKFQIPDIVHIAIKKAAQEFKVPESLLYDIALQESSFNPNLRNPDPASTASGLFQFTKGTWDTIGNYAKNSKTTMSNWNNPDRMDPEASARAAAYLIAMGQLGRWNASQGVWGPQYGQDELMQFYGQTAPQDIPTSNWR